MVRLTKKEKQDKRALLLSINQMNLNDSQQIDNAAFQHVKDNLKEINGKAGANETDLVFLRGLLDSPAVTQLIKITDSFEEIQAPLKPVQIDVDRLCEEIVEGCHTSRHPDVRELQRILERPHFKAIINTHDEIGVKQLKNENNTNSNNNNSSDSSHNNNNNNNNNSNNQSDINDITIIDSTDYNNKSTTKKTTFKNGRNNTKQKLKKTNSLTTNSADNNNSDLIMPGETIKMVGLRRNPKEPLGLTVELDEHKQLMVARILAGGMIDRQGLLHPGDVILEVNGVPVATPEELQEQISLAKESLTLKIGPSLDEEMKSARLVMSGGQVKNGRNLDTGKKMTCYMRALFDYNPEEDTLLPCKEIGLAFAHGDILQIINVKDPNWWQAKNLAQENQTGLIPSQELEERRKAFVPPEADFVHKISICGARISKRKKKTLYKSKSNCEYDKAELMLYEEVTRMPPFRRKTLVLIGVQGVGRRTLKNRLINSDAEKFGTIIPHTTRPPRVLEENGKGYWFASRDEIEEEIKQHKFLEYGEHNGNLYGTHLDSIRDVIKQGKMCVLDCAPSALKMLHNSTEFMPYVIFIAAPGMEQLKQLYAERRATGGSQRNLTFDRQSSIRYSSRRARTLESLASLYEDDDFIQSVEESTLLQRKYEKYIDLTIVNEDFDVTFRKVIEALETLSHEHQWVPVNWIY